MYRDLTNIANQVFPAVPDRITLYPAAGQQRVLAALQQDVIADRYLLCISGPAGSGKTVLLRALRQRFSQGMVGLIEQPTPGSILGDVARSLQLKTAGISETILRRRMLMMQTLAEKRHKPIIQMVDEVDRLSTDDLILLTHFFPPGLATLVLAGTGDPETWLAGCTTPFGSASIDRAYRLEPLSADGTTGYIRHRLRMAAMPVDLFQPAAIAAIYQQSAGLPGRINQRCAEALMQAGLQGKDSVTAAAPAVAIVTTLAIEPAKNLPRSTSGEGVTAEVTTAPALASVRRTVSSAPSVHTAPGNDYEADAVAGSARRVRRRVRSWRAIAIVFSIALALVLTKDAWIDRIPLDRTLLISLAELFAVPPASEHTARESGQSIPPSSPATPASPDAPDEPGQNSDFAAWHSPSFVHEDAAVPIVPSTNGSGLPSPRAPFNPPPATESARSSGSDPTAAPSADAPMYGASPVLEDAGSAGAPPDSAPPDTAAAAPATETPPLTRAQRAEIARLYAVRAEYEWRKGDLEAASISIELGLATDRRNPELLEMRALLREAMWEP